VSNQNKRLTLVVEDLMQIEVQDSLKETDLQLLQKLSQQKKKLKIKLEKL
jgi:hypothetical protein